MAGYVQRLTGAAEVVLGLPVTGRTTAEQRSVPGMLSNIAPLRLARQDTLRELVGAVGAGVREVLAHSRFRAEELGRELGVADGVAGLTGPTVNVIGYAPDLRFGDATATLHDLWPGPVSDLTVDRLRAAGRRASWWTSSRTRRCAGPTSSRPTRPACWPMLDAITATPDARLSDVTLVPDEARLLALGSAPRETEDVTWPAMFERQARRTPDAVALVCEDERADLRGAERGREPAGARC